MANDILTKLQIQTESQVRWGQSHANSSVSVVECFCVFKSFGYILNCEVCCVEHFLNTEKSSHCFRAGSLERDRMRLCLWLLISMCDNIIISLQV